MHTIVLQMATIPTLSVYDIYDHMDFTLTLGTAKLVFRILVGVKDVGTRFGLLMVTTREVQCNRHVLYCCHTAQPFGAHHYPPWFLLQLQPGKQRSSSFVFGQRRFITSLGHCTKAQLILYMGIARGRLFIQHR